MSHIDEGELTAGHTPLDGFENHDVRVHESVDSLGLGRLLGEVREHRQVRERAREVPRRRLRERVAVDQDLLGIQVGLNPIPPGSEGHASAGHEQ